MAQTEAKQIVADGVHDDARLRALRTLSILDTPVEEAFDRFTRLAAKLLRVPVALISLVDEHRQFFKSCIGLHEPWSSVRETPLSHSFCQHAVASRQPLIVDDARCHPLVHDNLAIRDLNVVAYAGIPLILASGAVLGTFCVIDHRPRAWSPDEVALLHDLATAVTTEIELRSTVRRSHELARAADVERNEKELLLASIGDPFVAVDRDWQVVYANEPARLLSVHPDETICGRAAWDIFPGLSDPTSRERLIDAMERQEPARFSLLWTASEQWYEIHVYPRPSGLALYMNNVTERHRAQQDQLRVRDADQAAQERQDEFLAAVAHDLRAPLTTVKGYAQLLARRAKQSGTVSAFQVMDASAQIVRTATRMTVLINELLDVNRLKAGRPLELVNTHTDLVRLVREVVEEQQQQTDNHRVLLQSDMKELMADIDAFRIERVLVNLVANAIKYSPGHGDIVVRVTREDTPNGGVAVLAVIDHGVGIPEADQKRIFDRFFRATNVDGAMPGSGIGLSSVQQIVHQHGGDLTVQSTEGEGSTFTVTLPLVSMSPVN